MKPNEKTTTKVIDSETKSKTRKEFVKISNQGMKQPCLPVTKTINELKSTLQLIKVYNLKCGFCDKLFYRKDSFVDHLKIHNLNT